jgi:ABC-type proline/glycine betaine transport system permease subunit
VGRTRSTIQITFMNVLIETNTFVHQLPSYYLQWLLSHYLQVGQISCLRYCVLSTYNVHFDFMRRLSLVCASNVMSLLVTGTATMGLRTASVAGWGDGGGGGGGGGRWRG